MKAYLMDRDVNPDYGVSEWWKAETSRWRRQSMTSDKTVKLPKDRKGQTLHIGDEVLVFNGTEPIGQGEVISMALVCFTRGIWSVNLHMGAIGDRRYRTSCGGFDPHELERIEVADDDAD